MPHKNHADALRQMRQYRAAKRAEWLKIKGNGPSAVASQHNIAIGAVKSIEVKGPKHGLKIAVIPDAQAMPDVPTDHLEHAGRYIADKRPDVIVCIGDFWDLPSLSRFEVNTLQAEGRRYAKDRDAGLRAMDRLMTPIAKARGYNPLLEVSTGNHEDHIRRCVNDNPKLEGIMSLADLRLADYGWRVHEFMQPISIAGVAFCHYFPSGVMGRPISTATALLRKLHMSAFAGHQQGREIAYARRADGGSMTAIISGSFYQHTYSYLSPFTNAHWRGMYFLHEVKGGMFDEMALSIDYLKRRYGK